MPVAHSSTASQRKATQWAPIGKRVIQVDDARQEKVQKRRCYRKEEYQDKPSYQRLQNSGRLRLEAFERASRYYFANCDMKLGYVCTLFPLIHLTRLDAETID